MLSGCDRLLHFHVILQADFPITFDQAIDSLQTIKGMFSEPDGSFFWASSQGGPRWQVEGNLYDQGDRLAYAELKGNCPEGSFDELLRAFGWPGTPLVFQLPEEGIYLDETGFRRFAAAPRT